MEEIQIVRKRPIVIKYSIITALILIAYFLLMKLSGLIQYAGLRFINYPLLAIGLIMALSELKKKTPERKLNYLPGIGMGFIIVVFTAILFSIFVFIYAAAIDTDFISLIWPQKSYNIGDYGPYAIGVFIFSETVMFGVIIDFVVMQFMKREDPPEEELSE